MRALDDALALFHVEREAYYNGTFVGNHVHRCLKVYIHNTSSTVLTSNIAHQEQNIDTLCASVPSTALQLFPSLHSEADQISTRFRKALILFRKCHMIFNKNYVDDEETVQLCKDYYMQLTTC